MQEEMRGTADLASRNGKGAASRGYDGPCGKSF